METITCPKCQTSYQEINRKETKRKALERVFGSEVKNTLTTAAIPAQLAPGRPTVRHRVTQAVSVFAGTFAAGAVITYRDMAGQLALVAALAASLFWVTLMVSFFGLDLLQFIIDTAERIKKTDIDGDGLIAGQPVKVVERPYPIRQPPKKEPLPPPAMEFERPDTIVLYPSEREMPRDELIEFLFEAFKDGWGRRTWVEKGMSKQRWTDIQDHILHIAPWAWKTDDPPTLGGLVQQIGGPGSGPGQGRAGPGHSEDAE
jgi:hypothetical protein